jgi:hypothetical protein
VLALRRPAQPPFFQAVSIHTSTTSSFRDGGKRESFSHSQERSRDHRLLIIKATSKGRRVAPPHLKRRFEEIRGQFFQGVPNVDIDRFELVLSQLHENAQRLCEERTMKDGKE